MQKSILNVDMAIIRPESLSNTEYEQSIVRLTQRRGQC